MRWIRQALPGDRDALAALYLDCLDGADWLPAAARAAADFERDTAGELVLVEWLADARVGATGAARPVGFVAAWVPDAFVHHLYVAADRRGQGTGQRLLAALVGRIALPWQLKCGQNNEAARRFYARRGWVQVSEEETACVAYALLELRNPPAG